MITAYPKIPDCTKSDKFSRQLGVEVEVGDFLYGLVRLTKPTVCVETGTYVGDSAIKICQALQENGFGHLDTCDIDEDAVNQARRRLQGFPVTVHCLSGHYLLSSVSLMDFVFIDSGRAEVRRSELNVLGTHNVSPLGIVALHDICHDCQEAYDFFAERGWRHLLFPSIVGLAVFQCPEFEE